MNLQEYLAHLNQGKCVQGGSELHAFMTKVSHEAMKITSELNGSYHTAEEIRELFSALIGKEVDETFGLFIRTAEKISRWGKMCLSIPAVIFRIRAESGSEMECSSVIMWCWQR